jgi:hypothetical protein
VAMPEKDALELISKRRQKKKPQQNSSQIAVQYFDKVQSADKNKSSLHSVGTGL